MTNVRAKYPASQIRAAIGDGEERHSRSLLNGFLYAGYYSRSRLAKYNVFYRVNGLDDARPLNEFVEDESDNPKRPRGDIEREDHDNFLIDEWLPY